MTKKRIVALLAVALFVALIVLTGCNGTNSMIMGRWSMSGIGDANGQNSQSYPLPVVVDIYPDGHVDMLDSRFGTFTRDRDTYTFKSDDGTFTSSGSYKIEFVTDSNTQQQIMQLTIFPDNAAESYIFQKQMNLPDLLKYLKSSAAAATPTPAAPAATPAASGASAPAETQGPAAPSPTPAPAAS